MNIVTMRTQWWLAALATAALVVTAVGVSAESASAAGFTLSGVVVGPSGDPVPDLGISLRGAGGDQSAFATTGADGSYAFQIPSGSYSLMSAQYYDQSSTFGTIDDTFSVAGLEVSASRRIDFQFPAVTALDVSVSDQSSQPVAGAALVEPLGGSVTTRALGEGGTVSFAADTGGTHMCTTLGDGHCALPALVASQTKFTLTPPGGFPQEESWAVDSTPSSASIILAPTVSIHGIVTEGGLPVEGSSVAIANSSGGRASTLSDAAGDYTLNVPAGTYDLEARTPEPQSNGAAASVARATSVAASKSTAVDIPFPGLTQLDVAVQEPDGTPIAGAAVGSLLSTAQVDDDAGIGFQVTKGAYACQTGAAGHCSVAVLRHSEVAFTIFSPPRPDQSFSASVGDDAAQTTAVLTGLVTVHGAVTRDDHTPIADQLIVFTDANHRATNVMTDLTGNYTVRLPAGEFDLSSIANIGAPGISDYRIEATEHIDVRLDATANITFPGTTTLDVLATDFDGSPLSDTLIRNYRSSRTDQDSGFAFQATRSDATCTTNSAARCVLPAIRGAQNELLAYPLNALYQRFTVASGDAPTTAQVTMPYTVTLSGRVKDASGSPIPQTPVYLDAPDLRQAASTANDAGTFVLHVPPGTYRLMSQRFDNTHDGYGVIATGNISLTTDVVQDFVYPVNGLAHFSIIDAAGKPVSGAVLTIPPNTSRTTRTLDDGTQVSFTGDVSRYLRCTTDSTGTCDLPAMVATSMPVTVAPPNGFPIQTTADVTMPVTSDVITLDSYTSVRSSGTSSGQVTISVPEGFTLSEATADPVAYSPEDSSALVGALSYRVSGLRVGGSVDVSLTLPTGAAPTNVYKTEPDGSSTDITSDVTIDGSVVVLHLTDGGFGDQDGVADGVVVDPLVPAAKAPLTITSLDLPGAALGKSYSANLAASGGFGPYRWSLAAGSLPAGLTLSDTGVISGTATTEETVTFTVRVTDSSSRHTSETKELAIVAAPVAVTSTTLPHGNVYAAYATSLAAVGGNAPYTWKIASGTLPPGITLSSAGKLSGTPRNVVTTWLTFEVTDSSDPANVAFRSMQLAVDPMTVATTTLASAPVGKVYGAQLATVGGKSPWVWSQIGGALPTGLKLSSGGAITGTPSVPGHYVFSVSVHDAVSPNPDVAQGSIEMTVAPMSISPGTVPSGLVNKAYASTTFKATGGKIAYTWTITAGSLPTGMKLSTSGTLSGTPTVAGAFPITLSVSDGSSPKYTAHQDFVVTIAPMSVATSSLKAGKVKTFYSATLTTSGGKSPFTWTVISGSLPPGLKLATGGALNGTPTTAGKYDFVVRVSDANLPKNTATRALSITVS